MKLYRTFCIVIFLIFWGWTIPAIFILIATQIYNIADIFFTQEVVFTDYNLLIFLPITLALYFLIFGPMIRTFLAQWLWFRPLLVIAFSTLLGLTLIVHLCFWATMADRSVLLAAIMGFVGWRIATAFFFRIVPLHRFIPRPRT
jgi:hypothetical protein